MGTENKLQWPAIEKLPTVFHYEIASFCDAAELAAKVIQRRQRQRSGRGAEAGSARAPAQRTRFRGSAAAIARLLGSHAACSVKYDGTNVGKTADGALFGRRRGIAGTSFQKTPVEPVREADVAGVYASLLKVAGMPSAVARSDFMLYGELMCNKGLYDYAAQRLGGTWQPFGILVALASPGDARVAGEALRGGGFRVRVMDQPGCGRPRVRVALCPALEALLATHGLSAAKTTATGPFLEVARSQAPWLVACRGEGLVVAITPPGGDECTLLKWKCAREPQPAVVDRLTALRRRFAVGSAARDVYARLLPAGTLEVLDLLHAVATSAAGGGAAKKAKKKAKKKATQPLPFDARRVTEAIDSACSKFDAAEAFFEDARRGRQTYADTILAEVVSSGDLGDSAQFEAQKDPAATQLRKAVMAMAGRRFGAWRQAQKARAAK